MAGHKAAQKPALLDATNESEPPQKKARRIVSVSTLFKQTQSLKRKNEGDVYDVLAPEPAGIAKQHMPARKADECEHPLYREFLGVTQKYRDAAGRGSGEQLDVVYKELVARIDDLNFDGAVLTADGKASETTIEALVAEEARLASPLSEDKIELQLTKADGSTVAQERKLSDTMCNFEQVLQQKRDEMGRLLRELEEVDAGIVAAKRIIHAVEQKEVQKLKRELDAEVASLLKQAATTYEATLAGVEKASKEEQKATKEQQRKFEAFLATI